MSIDSIKLIAIDVDGTLTDGNYYTNEAGVLFKNFNTRDMYGIHRASKDGFKIVIITGQMIAASMPKWGDRGIPLFLALRISFSELGAHLVSEGLTWDQVAYIGDAENDYRCIMSAAFSGCPADAVPEVFEHSVYSAHAKGGCGAVYEVIRYLYRLRKMEWKME